MLYREIPFLRLIVPLCAGIISGLWIRPGFVFFAVFSSFIILLFSASLFFNRYLTNKIYGIILTMALWLAGLMLYTAEKARISDLADEKTVYIGILDDMPEEKEHTWKMTVRLTGMVNNGHIRTVGGSLLLYHRKETDPPSFLPGDELTIKCRTEPIKSRGNPSEFDYRFFMENQGIRYLSFTDSSDIISHSTPDHRKLKHSALIIREKILEMFLERGISEKRLGLVAAMTLGQKNLLDPEQKQYFIKAGVMHIMAVSGLHTVILSLFIFRMLFFLKGKLNIVRILITLIILWIFAFITGLTPSVLRATLMYSFLQTGKAMKREVNPVNSILASAFILIMIRPSVIFDAGFLLSYSAVIFIICFYRDLYLRISFRYRIPDLIWQSAAVTIIAQAGTLPLTIMLFNRFPVWFILSNIIIVPLSSLVVITGVLIIVFYPIPFLSGMIGRLLDFLTGLTETLTEKAASLPLSTIENIGITSTECILLTITLFLFCRYLLNRKSIPVAFPLTGLLLFMLAGTIQDIPVRKSGEMIVYNTTGHTTVGIRTGKVLTSYSDTLNPGKEVNRHKAMTGLKEESEITDRNISVEIDGCCKILITDLLTSSILDRSSPDIIVLKGEKPVIGSDVRVQKNLKALVIGPEVQRRSTIKSLRADTVHFVKSSGAFHLRL